jgi:predicted NBD/HSP70 family sugar kinase
VGVGGGAVVGGHLHLGADGYSGEVGHLLVETGPGAARCRCGNTGCLESETGALALLRLSGREGLDPIPSTISAVVAAAAEGDQAARTALQLVGQRLGRGLGGLVNVLNPRRIVLGGWFAEAFDHLEPAVAEELARAALAPTWVGAQVVPAALRDRSALVGALEVVLEPLLADPLASPVRLPVGARA